MKMLNGLMQNQSAISYIIAIPDDFMLTNIPNLEELLTKITTKFGISKAEFSHAELARTLDGFKTERDIWMKKMSEIHWIIFSI